MSRGIEAALWGTATRHAEMRQAKSGDSFAMIDLAVSDGDATYYVRVFAFGGLAINGSKIKSGDRVYAEGSLSASVYESQKGPRVTMTLRAFLLHKTGIGKARPPRQNPQTDPQSTIGQAHEFEDEMPF